MYTGAMISVRSCCGATIVFPIVTMCLYQGSEWGPYLFEPIMNKITASIQEDVPWHMSFADDIVLIDEKRIRLKFSWINEVKL